MADLSVRISSLVYHYPESTHGLEDFTLDVPCGETWGLIGPNGAGKSTLLLLLDGLLKPMSGDIEVFGQSMKQNGSVDSIRRRMGIVFQNADDQVFCPTVFEDVVFGPLNHGLSNDEAHDLAHEAPLDGVGLAHDEGPVRHSGAEPTERPRTGTNPARRRSAGRGIGFRGQSGVPTNARWVGRTPPSPVTAPFG